MLKQNRSLAGIGGIFALACVVAMWTEPFAFGDHAVHPGWLIYGFFIGFLMMVAAFVAKSPLIKPAHSPTKATPLENSLMIGGVLVSTAALGLPFLLIVGFEIEPHWLVLDGMLLLSVVGLIPAGYAWISYMKRDLGFSKPRTA